MLDTNGRKFADLSINTVAKACIKMKLTANNVTLIALIIGVISSVLIYFGYNIIAVLVLWGSGLLDSVDGAIARLSKTSSLFGTLMDITFDRIVEISIIVSLGLLHRESLFSLMLLACSIIISMTIFLTVGALSENNGKKTFRYQAGLIERTEAFIFFSLMILLPTYLTVITITFAVLIFITAIQRFYEASKIL